MIPADDDAERSDEEERRMIPADDDAERSDAGDSRPQRGEGERSGAYGR
jgi:hypothetical protein